jgi:hypothetical protein
MTNHLELFEMEKVSEASNPGWERWCATAEALLGWGDLACASEGVNGFSLDSAYDAYMYDISPAEYAAGKRDPHWSRREEDPGIQAHMATPFADNH